MQHCLARSAQAIAFTLLACLTLTAHSEMPTRHTVMAAGHPLVVWEKSPANPSATLLLLHGRTWSALPDFDLQVDGESLSLMDSLNALGYATYALDARGYGATPRDAAGWLTPDRAARDATTTLNWLKARTDTPVIMFGWSYGAMIAQLAVQRDASLADGLILFGYPFDPARHVTDPSLIYPATAPALPNPAENAASDFIVPGAISQHAIDTFVSAALTADPVRVDFKNLHEWAELAPELIRMPTLLVHGELDPLAKPEMQAAVFSHIDHGNKWWVVLPNGAHASLLEKARKPMLSAMDGFLRSLMETE